MYACSIPGGKTSRSSQDSLPAPAPVARPRSFSSGKVSLSVLLFFLLILLLFLIVVPPLLLTAGRAPVACLVCVLCVVWEDRDLRTSISSEGGARPQEMLSTQIKRAGLQAARQASKRARAKQGGVNIDGTKVSPSLNLASKPAAESADLTKPPTLSSFATTR